MAALPARTNPLSGVTPLPSGVMHNAPRAAAPPSFTPEAGAEPFPGYRLVRLRGRGGFATVWESTSPAGEHVALKFMSSAAERSTARELRSLQAIQSLSHPGLLRTQNIWSLPGWIVIAMDLADASLLDLLTLYVEEFGAPIGIDKLGVYMSAAAEALDFLNARTHRIDGKLVSLQHGDIKPNNILLVRDRAQLADYGLATPMAGPSTPCSRHGTAEYVAPEVFQGNLSDRSDQFGFAVTYFILRTGHFPFPAPPGPPDQLRHYSRPEPDLTPLLAHERAAVGRALSVAPQRRHPNCQEMVRQLLLANGLAASKTDDGGWQVKPDESSVTRSQLFK